MAFQKIIDSMNITNLKLDATLKNGVTGIVVLDDTVSYLRDFDSNKKLMDITSDNKIFILNDSELFEVDYKKLINTVCKDAPDVYLYSGQKAVIV